LHKKENAAFAAKKKAEEEAKERGEEQDEKDKEYWGVYGTPITGGREPSTQVETEGADGKRI
jgi:hypothetical protein